jgi:hypothetical protein
MGNLQQKRSMDKKYNEVKEELIKRDIFFHHTMETMLPGATYKYAEEVANALEKDSVLRVLKEKKTKGNSSTHLLKLDNSYNT